MTLQLKHGVMRNTKTEEKSTGLLHDARYCVHVTKSDMLLGIYGSGFKPRQVPEG